MAKETKYGLCLIAVLSVGLMGATVWRVSRELKQRGTTLTAPEVASAADAPSHEPPKLLLRAADGDRPTGEAAPPTSSLAMRSTPGSSTPWSSPAEPGPMPPRHRYPLMPAAAATEAPPSLSAEVAPAKIEPIATPHTSYRPDDGADSATSSTGQTQRETIAVAAEQPIEGPRYADADYAAPLAAVQAPPSPHVAAQREPQPEPRSYRRPEAGFAAPRSFAPQAPQQLAATGDRGDGTAVVRPNDTFWTISERAYGSGAYFKALIRYNADKHPQADRLAVGETVLVPPLSELTQKYPHLCPKPRRGGEAGIRNAAAPMTSPGGRHYEVREGDTLFNIARFELGDGARWTEIYQLNRDQLTDDFHYLKPGSTLVLPGRRQQQTDRVAREPADTRQR